MFGPVGLQALYPPNPNTQPIFIPQVHQRTMYPPHGSFHQPVPYVPHHTQQASTASEFQVKQNHESYGAPITWDRCQNDVVQGSEGQRMHVVGQEGQLAVVNQSEERVVDNRLEQSIITQPPENYMTNSEHVAPAKDVTLSG
ncbi:hypothetical protein IFM89_005576 [Coptis chinensis]|uniref:Uncharacterized protein n=1 Tax=Coptis chinensis TaxID=261450 RepID=A0A835IAB3_9MAGN|nr:hypothetical protein IFM89_005576 [Coptis chinensis]